MQAIAATAPPGGAEYSVRDVARRLGVSRGVVLGLARRGFLGHRRRGGVVRVPRAALATFERGAYWRAVRRPG